MTSLAQWNPIDRLLALSIAVLMVATLALATETHTFCSIFCIHGDRMIETQICSGQS